MVFIAKQKNQCLSQHCHQHLVALISCDQATFQNTFVFLCSPDVCDHHICCAWRCSDQKLHIPQMTLPWRWAHEAFGRTTSLWGIRWKTQACKLQFVLFLCWSSCPMVLFFVHHLPGVADHSAHCALWFHSMPILWCECCFDLSLVGLGNGMAATIRSKQWNWLAPMPCICMLLNAGTHGNQRETQFQIHACSRIQRCNTNQWLVMVMLDGLLAANDKSSAHLCDWWQLMTTNDDLCWKMVPNFPSKVTFSAKARVWLVHCPQFTMIISFLSSSPMTMTDDDNNDNDNNDKESLPMQRSRHVQCVVNVHTLLMWTSLGVAWLNRQHLPPIAEHWGLRNTRVMSPSAGSMRTVSWVLPTIHFSDVIHDFAALGSPGQKGTNSMAPLPTEPTKIGTIKPPPMENNNVRSAVVNLVTWWAKMPKISKTVGFFLF